MLVLVDVPEACFTIKVGYFGCSVFCMTGFPELKLVGVLLTLHKLVVHNGYRISCRGAFCNASHETSLVLAEGIILLN